MRFESIEVEDYYMELQKEFGYFHVNFGHNYTMTMEDLHGVREDLLMIREEYGKKG